MNAKNTLEQNDLKSKEKGQFKERLKHRFPHSWNSCILAHGMY